MYILQEKKNEGQAEGAENGAGRAEELKCRGLD
jgi:hypothetical protein